MTIEEGNKLIAEFIGYEHDDPEESVPSITYYVDDHLENISGKEAWETNDEDWTSWLRVDEMRFHSSWNWLMPVVEKIERTTVDEIKLCTSIEGNSCTVYGTHIFKEGETKIEAVWNVVVEFIQWYNNEKNRS